MMEIRIIDIIHTPNAILQKFGLQVFEEIKNNISKGEVIELSFDGVKNLTTGFCHASIGKIYTQFPQSADNLLKLTHISPDSDWKDKIQEAIAYAKEPTKAENNDKAISDLFC